MTFTDTASGPLHSSESEPVESGPVEATGESAPSEADEQATQERLALGESTIKNYVMASMALGLVPVPVFDVIAIVGVQLKMIHALARQYDVPFQKNMAKSIVLALLGGVLPVAVTVGAASLFQVVPVIGTLAGGASVAILSGALTYAVGKVFQQHFEAGGTLINFDVQKVRDRFKFEFKRGKAVAAEARAEVGESTANAA